MFGCKFHRLCLLLALLMVSFSAYAQSNELAVTVGGYFPVNSDVGAGNAFAVGGSFAHRIAHLPLVSLYAEIPVFATFNSTTSVIQTANGRASYSTLFVTPGLKLKVAPAFPISPYVLAGGGVAHFSKSNVTTDSSTYSGTFEVGGGLDWKIFPFISARAEAREFYSGNPDIVNGLSNRQHQLIASAGLVFRF
jgi:opacity protein-like surface antigen